MARISFLFAGAALVLAGAFAQTTMDANGVTVDLNGAPLLHRQAVRYPFEAIAKSVQGTVVAQVRLSQTGEVVDAHIVSGPDELRAAVLQSVLSWHFSPQIGNTTREVSVTFQLPKNQAATVQRSGVIGGIIGAVPRGAANSASAGPSRIKAIRISGLSDAAQQELLAQLPVHEGDTISPELLIKAHEAVRNFDEHLSFSSMRGPDGETTIGIAAPGAFANLAGSAPAPPQPLPPGTITVGGNVQQTKLTSQTPPAYPPLAKQARIQGVVHLQAVIGADGRVIDLRVISGHPLLVQAALEAVKTWTYQPTLVNGAPVPVQTQIDVNFTLSQ